MHKEEEMPETERAEEKALPEEAERSLCVQETEGQEEEALHPQTKV